MNIDCPDDPEFARLERIIVMHVLQGEEISDADLRALSPSPWAR